MSTFSFSSRTPLVQNHEIPCSCCLTSNVCPSYWLRWCFLGAFHPLQLLQSLCLLFIGFLNLKGGGRLMEISCSWLSVSPMRCAMSSCVFLFCFPSSAWGSFSGEGWAKHWSRSSADCHYELCFWCAPVLEQQYLAFPWVPGLSRRDWF